MATCTCKHDAGSHDYGVGFCRVRRPRCGCKHFVNSGESIVRPQVQFDLEVIDEVYVDRATRRLLRLHKNIVDGKTSKTTLISTIAAVNQDLMLALDRANNVITRSVDKSGQHNRWKKVVKHIEASARQLMQVKKLMNEQRRVIGVI